MTSYLRARDFSALLYYIVRPDVLADPKGFELPLPWSLRLERDSKSVCTSIGADISTSTDAGAGAVDVTGNIKDQTEKWKCLELLLELQKKDIIQSVPHIILGGVTEPYMIVQLAEPYYFPPNAFTFSLWLKLQKEKIVYDGLSGWCIPILSLSGGTSSFLEVHWEIDTRLIRVMVNKKGSVSVIHFLLPMTLPVDFFDWNLLVITVHAKKLPSRGFMKSAVCLFFNGLPCPPVGAHTIAIDIPAGNVDICVGRFIMDASIAYDEGTKEELNIISSSLKTTTWGFGPILLWDDSLSNVQLSLIFLRGPTYTGSFQGESPLTDHLSSISCGLLRKCDLSGLHVEAYVNDLGLKGLERVVDPPMERLSSLVSSFDLPVLPPAMLAYSPESAISTYSQDFPLNPSSSGIFSEGSYVQILLPCNNSYSGLNADLPPAIIKNSRVSRPSSLSYCVSTYGGPNILFPMLESAITEDQLIGSLKLIRQVTLGDNSNLKYMQIKGYKILAFILHNKNKKLITLSIMDELFNFSVSYGKTKFSSYGKSNLISTRNSLDGNKRNLSNGSNNCNDTLLLVDTPALYYLILNHQIWSIKRSTYIQKVVTYLELLSSNLIHGDINSQRLAILGNLKLFNISFLVLYTYFFLYWKKLLFLFIYHQNSYS